jgi:hypothetical protein
LPVCSSTSTSNQNTARPNIPSSSRVIYLPAPPPRLSSQQPATTSIDQFRERVDITISKLLEVVSRHSPPPFATSDLNLSDGEDHHAHLGRPLATSSDEETEYRVVRDTRRSVGRRRRRTPEFPSHCPVPNHSESTLSSSSVVSADSVQDAIPSSSERAGSNSLPPRTGGGGEISDGSDSSPEPPKKRARCDSRALVTDQTTLSFAIEPETETGNSDVPRPAVELRQSPEVPGDDFLTSVDKELLTELSCEICFAIYYQPVTTPCQHVSRPFSFLEHSTICHFLSPLSTRDLFRIIGV